MEGKVALFLSGYGYGDGYGSGYGDGSGSGYGSGYGSGSGSGDGSGYGYGYGSGSGDGSGYGPGDGSGYGSGRGDGYGSGSGSGSGYGSGRGDGYGVAIFRGQEVHCVDGLQTLIYSVKGQVAKGAILLDDLTIKPCYIAKIGQSFAHGDTKEQALRDAKAKYDESRPLEERIASFWEQHTPGVKYPASQFYIWHNTLTGSCQLGRDAFMRSKNISLTDEFTPEEFFEMTKGQYGGESILATKAAMPPTTSPRGRRPNNKCQIQ